VDERLPGLAPREGTDEEFLVDDMADEVGIWKNFP
jgi:hypothetical protein